ncbi:hypothetical protein CBER1_04188 [Cercospora berteroae]|uniref:Uncharacterized protein n=1 Tax=Cercospora berteroae TaxID=357750 RepID=A0A2S6CN45_9PEZI|nr:hypothetical protein CBER1_04188 [Cercospora berteroae]
MSSTCSESSGSPDGFLGYRYPRISSRSTFVLSTLLPALIPRRLSKLRHFRPTVVQDETLSQHSHLAGYLEDDSEGSATPPPSYATDDNRDLSCQNQPAVLRWVQETRLPGRVPSRPTSSGSTTSNGMEEPSQETARTSSSGVQWKYANPGLASITLAQSEDPGASSSSIFPRKQYVSGVACLLHGLPQELSEDELQNLREALPQALKADTISDGQLEVRSKGNNNNVSARPVVQRPMLHNWVAMFTLYMFLAASFILPYVQFWLRAAYQFDRKHKISEKLLSHGIDTAAAMRRHTLTIATQVCSMNDGKVGEQLKDVSMYMVQGVSAGVYDGIGEGMQVLGLRANKRE